eukprot:scaffold11319_cov61-Phaeocystis_antarctica.AAC.5
MATPPQPRPPCLTPRLPPRPPPRPACPPPAASAFAVSRFTAHGPWCGSEGSAPSVRYTLAKPPVPTACAKSPVAVCSSRYVSTSGPTGGVEGEGDGSGGAGGGAKVGGGGAAAGGGEASWIAARRCSSA